MNTACARLVVAAAVWGGAAAWGAGPTTRPGALVEVDPGAQILSGEAVSSPIRFRLKLAAGAGAPSHEEIKGLIETLRWKSGTRDAVVRWDVRQYAPMDGEAVVECLQLVSGDGTGFDIQSPGGMDEANRSEAGLMVGLERIFTADREVQAEARVKRVKEIEGKLAEVRSMRASLEAMTLARPPREAVLGERIKALRAERDRLEMIKSSKEARRRALQMGIEDAREKAAMLKKSDEVAKELRTMLELQEQEAKRIQTMVENGAAGRGELTEAQTKVALARVRVAEREGAGGGAKGEVLARLSDELAMVEVDDLEVRMQIEDVEKKLKRLDPARATTQSLVEAAGDGTVPGGAGEMPPLYGELGRKERELVREKVVLQVEGVGR